MANPYVFIVGCPRSGTTLLQRLADAHPQLVVTHESKWFDKRWIMDWVDRRVGLTPEGYVTPELITRMIEHPKFSRLEMGREDLLQLLGTGKPISFSDFVARVFDRYGERKGKALVGNKTPVYVRRLWTLHKLWPTARFVHLIRDGRDVCLSLRHWPKGPIVKGTFSTSREYPISTAALWWELNVRLGREVGSWLGPELYYEVHYESLLANPKAECAALCGFLDLPYDDAMLRFHEGRTKTDPTLDAKRAWRPLTPGLRNWKAQMSAEDLEEFEAAAGDLLEELGYRRAVPRPRRESVERVVRIRALLAQDSSWNRIVKRARVDGLETEPGFSDTWAVDQGDVSTLDGAA